MFGRWLKARREKKLAELRLTLRAIDSTFQCIKDEADTRQEFVQTHGGMESRTLRSHRLENDRVSGSLHRERAAVIRQITNLERKLA